MSVQTQMPLGTLFQNPNSIVQKPDFVWGSEGERFVGDAKYKLLGARSPQISEDENEVGHVKISPDDARQLITYSELARLQWGKAAPMRVFFPVFGFPPPIEPRRAWNGAEFRFVPVKLVGWQTPGDAIE